MNCLSPDRGDPLELCNATVGQLSEAYPVWGLLLKLFVVASAVAVLGVVAAVTLVAWNRRARRHRQAPVARAEVRYAPGRSAGAPADGGELDYGAETVVLSPARERKAAR